MRNLYWFVFLDYKAAYDAINKLIFGLTIKWTNMLIQETTEAKKFEVILDWLSTCLCK